MGRGPSQPDAAPARVHAAASHLDAAPQAGRTDGRFVKPAALHGRAPDVPAGQHGPAVRTLPNELARTAAGHARIRDRAELFPPHWPDGARAGAVSPAQPEQARDLPRRGRGPDRDPRHGSGTPGHADRGGGVARVGRAPRRPGSPGGSQQQPLPDAGCGVGPGGRGERAAVLHQPAGRAGRDPRRQRRQTVVRGRAQAAGATGRFCDRTACGLFLSRPVT